MRVQQVKYKRNLRNMLNDVLAISTTEYKKAELRIWSHAQSVAFGEEMKYLQLGKPISEKSKLRDWLPLWDEKEHVIRARTRLGRKRVGDITLLLLPKHSLATERFVLYVHRKWKHASPSMVASILREQCYEVQSSRKEIRRILYLCSNLRCLKPKCFPQQMAPLPLERQINMPVFASIGLDYFGPIMAKDCGNVVKTYGLIIVCFVTRCVSLQLCRSLGSQDFIEAFRRHCAIYGTPTYCYSDNAKTFKFCKAELKRIINETSPQGITWNHITETASHMGGLYERLVRSTKIPLKIVLGRNLLPFEELRTLLTEIAQILNDRPLAVQSTLDNQLTPISPSMLLFGRKLSVPLGDDQAKLADEFPFTRIFNYRKRLLNLFWQRFRKEYLQMLGPTRKWRNVLQLPIEEGVVVLIDDKTARNEWKLGRILKTHISKDGLIRSVTLKTATGSTINRPLNKLAILEGQIFKT